MNDRTASRVAIVGLLLVSALLCACSQSQDGLGISLGVSSRALAQAAPPAANPLPANEQSARAAIATERVEDLSADAQKAYRKLEKEALRAALATKKKLLKQAESGRPTAASPDRDLLDARLSEMRAEIATGDQKLAVLDAQPQ